MSTIVAASRASSPASSSSSFRAGWNPGDPVSSGDALHTAYLQATTMTFAGIVACQVGTAIAARTERASLRSVGFFTNGLLLWGIASEICFAALLVYAPPVQRVFGTAALGIPEVAFLLPFPLIVWGADELKRWLLGRRATRQAVSSKGAGTGRGGRRAKAEGSRRRWTKEPPAR